MTENARRISGPDLLVGALEIVAAGAGLVQILLGWSRSPWVFRPVTLAACQRMFAHGVLWLAGALVVGLCWQACRRRPVSGLLHVALLLAALALAGAAYPRSV